MVSGQKQSKQQNTQPRNMVAMQTVNNGKTGKPWGGRVKFDPYLTPYWKKSKQRVSSVG